LPSPSPSSPTSAPAKESGDEKAGSRRDGTADTEAPDSGTASTPQERRAEVDGRLDESLGTFDEALRKEQQQTAQERDTRASQRADGAAVDAAARGTESQIDRDRSGDLRSDRKDKSGEGNEKSSGGESKSPQMNQGGGGAAARPIPSGEDDDIIARRLRKAAEAETDPELKEKLWNEYRDYKANTTRSGT
jgi:hypothetical protein